MRILFMGTPAFAVPSLESIVREGHNVVLVVTRPDAPRGRGRRASAPPVKTAALRLGLELFQPASVNEGASVERLRAARPDIGVVVAYGELLSPRTLSVPPRGFLNVHASLLPKYRGAAPIHWAIIRGESESGISVQRLVPELDAGPILAQRPVSIGPDETAGELHDRLAELAAGVLAEVLGRLDRGEPVPERPQPADGVTYAPKLTPRHRRVAWDRPAPCIRNLVRGLSPRPGAVSRFVGRDRAEDVLLLAVEASPAAREAHRPGTVLRAEDREGIVVQAGSGSVIIRVLKPASGRTMSAGDFLRGRRVRPGDRFE